MGENGVTHNGVSFDCSCGGHSFEVVLDRSEPTNDEPEGALKLKCSGCGALQPLPLPKDLRHQLIQWNKEVTTPDCP